MAYCTLFSTDADVRNLRLLTAIQASDDAPAGHQTATILRSCATTPD